MTPADQLLSRRALLAGSLATAAAISHARSLSAQKLDDASETGDGYVDAHVHVWTPDTQHYPLAEGYKPADMKPASFTPEQLFQHTRPAGVKRVVLIQMSYYRYDNRYMLETIARFPGVFRGVAIVDETSERPQDAMRRLKEQGVRGFRIHPGKMPADTWFDQPGMQAMWKCAAEENLAICPLINPEVLPALEKMCRRYSATRVVIDHMARIGMHGAIQANDLDHLVALASFPNVYVKISAFYALGKKQPPYTDLSPMIERLVGAFGPGRLMWASDSPFQVQGDNTYRASLELVRDRLAFLSADDKDRLLRRTANEVFFT